MQYLINGFQFLVDTINTLTDLLISFITSIITLFQIIGTTLTVTTQFIATLPTFFQVFAMLTVSISVFYLVANRQTGSD